MVLNFSRLSLSSEKKDGGVANKSSTNDDKNKSK